MCNHLWYVVELIITRVYKYIVDIKRSLTALVITTGPIFMSSTHSSSYIVVVCRPDKQPAVLNKRKEYICQRNLLKEKQT